VSAALARSPRGDPSSTVDRRPAALIRRCATASLAGSLRCHQV